MLVTGPLHRNAGARMAEPADVHFLEQAASLKPPASPRAPGALTGEECLRLFDAQLGSRHLDLAARWLRAQDRGYYTIGSSGHEGNAAVAAALRPDDPALLHYRSGGFYCARAQQVGVGGDDGDGEDRKDPLVEAARDVLRGVVAAATEPIAGGRHK